MAFTPPNPGFSPKFLSDLKGCTFVPSLTALHDAHGAAMSVAIVQGAVGGSSVDWALVDASTAGTACPLASLDHLTFNVLSRGEPNPDGTLAFEGGRYRVVASVIDGRMGCAAVPA